MIGVWGGLFVMLIMAPLYTTVDPLLGWIMFFLGVLFFGAGLLSSVK